MVRKNMCVSALLQLSVAFSPWQHGSLLSSSFSLTQRVPTRSFEVSSSLGSSSGSSSDVNVEPSSAGVDGDTCGSGFDLTTAVFCGGLAFDAYAPPDRASSRWENGPSGLNVAFQSSAYTRGLYRGLLQVVPLWTKDLPDEDDTAEGLLSGGGMDAYLMAALAERPDDIEYLEVKEKVYHSGVWDLQGSAHAGRGPTAWSNRRKEDVERMERRLLRNREKAGAATQTQAQAKVSSDGTTTTTTTSDEAPREMGLGSRSYHIPSQWTTGGQAVWEEDPTAPFYLYVRDPAEARVVFTVMDEDVVGSDSIIGSAVRRLTDLMPSVRDADDVRKVAARVKAALLKEGIQDPTEVSAERLADLTAQTWEGTIPLNVIPRKKDKGGQVAMGAMAGAMVAGPAGAAVGGLLGKFYEGMARGKLRVRLRYLPIPSSNYKRSRYDVKGGLPGIDWGELYKRHVAKTMEALENDNLNDAEAQQAPSLSSSSSSSPKLNIDDEDDDLELCVYVQHEKTGCSCAIYRSLRDKLIAVSFRGTCAPVDLLTDASIVQTTWVASSKEDTKERDEDEESVHVGFRSSLDSVSRRVKELCLGCLIDGSSSAAPSSLSEFDLIVTGHSLGGALATLFAADVAEHGLDAGRGLPQQDASEPWWSRMASLFGGNNSPSDNGNIPNVPRPKSLKVYSFGSPRVGNQAFVRKFDSLVESGRIDEAYRIVNNLDIIARLPRTFRPILGVGYDHCGPTVLLSSPSDDKPAVPLVWVEGETDDTTCSVRDGTLFASAAKNLDAGVGVGALGGFLAPLNNIDRQYFDREKEMFKSVLSGDAISDHMEDRYYAAMGRACGFVARVGEEIRVLDSINAQES